MDQNNIQTRLQMCYKVYELYSNILNSYVSDYYIEDHWKILPLSWKNYFNNININDLSLILDLSNKEKHLLQPLSLLCLRKIITSQTLPRKLSNIPETIEDTKFMNLFWKNVKLKKRHEIDVMAKLCLKLAKETNCFCIVDIGSGIGHLSRMLAYGYGLRVCTFEADETLVKQAKLMDQNFEETLNKRNIIHKSKFKTVHIHKKITSDLTEYDFIKMVSSAFGECGNYVKFGIVGLHPCGNLGAMLLKLYTRGSNIKFINIASCCYMKLTLEPKTEAYFPLSEYCKRNNFNLTYLACEIACHAIENYSEKLKNSEEYEKLKIHAYRAALEDILVTIDPKLKHSKICGAKCDKNLSFSMYINKVCDKMNLMLDNKVLLYENIIDKTWREVVTFYSIRLLISPIIENVILLDRMLYVLESGSECTILPVFDCNISPRNLVLSGSKIKN